MKKRLTDHPNAVIALWLDFWHKAFGCARGRHEFETVSPHIGLEQCRWCGKDKKECEVAG